jgi:hypothetical protein
MLGGMNSRDSFSLNRRAFLRHTLLSVPAAGLWLPTLARGQDGAGDKLRLGVIGVAGRGGDNLNGVAGEHIAALCDVDDRNLAAAAQKFPGARTFHDYRQLLDLKGLDAVVISTPDHTHAVAAAAALKRGLHVYCEKPLTRTVSECRAVTEAARERRRVTQLGTQIHAGRNYRRVVELVRSGIIGAIPEVHVWVNASYGGKDRPKDTPPVPAHLHYDLWLGPVEYQPYHPDYVPFAWRHWWAFGGGSLADFGCHFMDLPFWALDLSHAREIEPVDGPPVHPDSTPPWLIMRYRFPARPGRPPVTLTWYHGGKEPALLKELLPEESPSYFKSGVLFVGERGFILSDYGQHLLLPVDKFKDVARPQPTIPDSLGHHEEWVKACKEGGTTTCSFDYSGPLTETALLGNVAYRVGARIEWDAKAFRAGKPGEAEPLIQHHYREGWRL